MPFKMNFEMDGGKLFVILSSFFTTDWIDVGNDDDLVGDEVGDPDGDFVGHEVGDPDGDFDGDELGAVVTHDNLPLLIEAF